MKFLKISFLTVLSFITITINAQKIESGSIKMEITDVNSDNEQTAAGLEMMKGMVTEYSFSPDQSLSKTDMMGGMVKSTSLVNNKTEEMTMLMDLMGNKMLVESTKEERDRLAGEADDMMENVKVEYDETDTKTIQGYECVKATIMGLGTEEMSMKFTMYLSKDLLANNKMIQGMDKLDLKGFPLEYVIETDQMSMTYTATEVSTELDKEIFNVSTSGYTKMTWKEFMEQMGSMGGGMGF